MSQLKRVITLRGRENEKGAIAIGTSREHLSRYVNGRFSRGDAARSPNFAQVLVDKLFEELGLKVVLVLDEMEVLLKDK